jgi:hypothetical protein
LATYGAEDSKPSVRTASPPPPAPKSVALGDEESVAAEVAGAGVGAGVGGPGAGAGASLPPSVWTNAALDASTAPAASSSLKPPLAEASTEPNAVLMPVKVPSEAGAKSANVLCAATIVVGSCAGAPSKETETRKAEAEATASSTFAPPQSTMTPCSVGVCSVPITTISEKVANIFSVSFAKPPQ